MPARGLTRGETCPAALCVCVCIRQMFGNTDAKSLDGLMKKKRRKRKARLPWIDALTDLRNEVVKFLSSSLKLDSTTFAGIVNGVM